MATLPHHAEMLDDHACNSNHKKLLSMINNLHAKYMDATMMSSQTDLYYLDITRTVKSATLTVWDNEVRVAEARQGTDIKVMNLYTAQLSDQLDGGCTVTSTTASKGIFAPVEQWIEFTLVVEETQYIAILCYNNIHLMPYEN